MYDDHSGQIVALKIENNEKIERIKRIIMVSLINIIGKNLENSYNRRIE